MGIMRPGGGESTTESREDQSETHLCLYSSGRTKQVVMVFNVMKGTPLARALSGMQSLPVDEIASRIFVQQAGHAACSAYWGKKLCGRRSL